jgi:hypothetical protein
VYDFATAREVAENIPGWLAPSEAEALYRLGYEIAADVVEIGSYFGKSTYLIARGMADAGADGHRVISIDVHYRGVDETTQRPQVFAEDAPSFLLRTMREQALDHLVMHFVGWSHVAVRYIDFERVGAVFIDGGHEYESVRNDVLAVRPRLRGGARLLFHDYLDEFPGVMRAIDELVRADPALEYVGLTHSLFECRLAEAADRRSTVLERALEQRATDAERLLQEMRSRLADEQREVGRLRDGLAAAQADATHLRERMATEVAMRQAEVSALLSSTSWRMTAPLRWGMDRLRGKR